MSEENLHLYFLNQHPLCMYAHCACVCMFVCTYIHTYILYINTYVYISVHTRACVRACVCVCVRACVCMYVCIYIIVLPQLVSPMAQVSGYTQLFQKSHKYAHQNCQYSCHQQTEEPASAAGPVYCKNNNFSHISGNTAKQVLQKLCVSV
jgi:hypothetical protein